MAKGRVGGTRSRLSGKVGDEVYTVHRDDDGTYTQVVSAMPDTRDDTLTPELVKQRMCMSICYRYMSALAPVINKAFDNKLSKPLNLQEFVRINVPRLRQRMEDTERESDPIWYYQYGDENVYPAPVKLSQEIKLQSWLTSKEAAQGDNSWSANVGFGSVIVGDTIGAWRKRYGLEIGDLGVILLQLVDADPTRNCINLLRLTFNGGLGDNYLLTAERFPQMFTVDGDCPFEWWVKEDPSHTVMFAQLRFRSSMFDNISAIGGIAWILSRQRNGLWQRGEGVMNTAVGKGTSKTFRNDLDDVWDSWYTDRL